MEKRILTVQDVSCVGQCSLTVALPILSAFGLETAVLPTAVLSNHTYRFGGWTFADLTEEMPKICDRWEKEGLDFDAVYTGYLASKEQIDHIADLVKSRLKPGGLLIVDPVMADDGKLYTGFDEQFVKEMTKLVRIADVIVPNITEACLLTGNEYIAERHTQDYIDKLLTDLEKLGAKKTVLTGVTFHPKKLGVAVYEDGMINFRFLPLVDKKCHGTGDIFASALTGAYVQGDSLVDAAEFAAEVVVDSLLKTEDSEQHWYGVRFEKVLPKITERNK